MSEYLAAYLLWGAYLLGMYDGSPGKGPLWMRVTILFAWPVIYVLPVTVLPWLKWRAKV